MIACTPQAILDEFWFFNGGLYDGLREDLRQIEGVPNAVYLVLGRQVFVFEKLVQLVANHLKFQPNLPLADLARGLIAKATCSAEEAVEQWAVLPHPYELSRLEEGGWRIRHRPFDATLPGVYQSKRDLTKALASLMLGNNLPGNGDFSYRGQQMSLSAPLDTSLLPSRPVCGGVDADHPVITGYRALDQVTYEAGFEPVTETLFNDVKNLEMTWKRDSASAIRYASTHVLDLWEGVSSLRLETLAAPVDEVLEYEQQDLDELRQFYPELSMLSDGSLYGWFDAYQAECGYRRGWSAVRDDRFVFFLLGQVAGRPYEQDSARTVGQWVAFALLRGDSMDAALAFGWDAAVYDRAISSMAQRIENAVRYLAKNKSETELKGPPISTVMDLLRMVRSGDFSLGKEALSVCGPEGSHEIPPGLVYWGLDKPFSLPLTEAAAAELSGKNQVIAGKVLAWQASNLFGN